MAVQQLQQANASAPCLHRFTPPPCTGHLDTRGRAQHGSRQTCLHFTQCSNQSICTSAQSLIGCIVYTLKMLSHDGTQNAFCLFTLIPSVQTRTSDAFELAF